MSKYIIEIPDDVQYVLLNGQTDNKCYTAVRPVAELEVLNSDYINEHFGELQDEAYQRGHDDGYEAGCATAFKPVSDAEYQRGLEDAWEAARRIIHMPEGNLLNIFTECYSAVCTALQVLLKYDASEAIEKLKAYDDKQKDRIEVWDEVNWDGDCFIVTKIFQPRNMKEQCDGIDDYGSAYHDILMEDLKKTGKHYDIQSILEAMRE